MIDPIVTRGISWRGAWLRVALSLLVVLLVLPGSAQLPAGVDSGTIPALQLDGRDGTHLNLPAGCFDDLAEARTQDQIRENQFRRLAGTEPGLVVLLGFDEGDARDATANRFDGRSVGAVEAIREEFPTRQELVPFTVVTGQVFGEMGQPVPGAEVRAEREGRVLRSVRSDSGANFRLLVESGSAMLSLSANDGNARSGTLANVRLATTETNLNLTLRPTGRPTGLSGRVLALDGTPMPAVYVEAISQAPAAGFPNSGPREAGG